MACLELSIFFSFTLYHDVIPIINKLTDFRANIIPIRNQMREEFQAPRSVIPEFIKVPGFNYEIEYIDDSPEDRHQMKYLDYLARVNPAEANRIRELITDDSIRNYEAGLIAYAR